MIVFDVIFIWMFYHLKICLMQLIRCFDIFWFYLISTIKCKCITIAGCGCGTSLSGTGSQLLWGVFCSLNAPSKLLSISDSVKAQTAEPRIPLLYVYNVRVDSNKHGYGPVSQLTHRKTTRRYEKGVSQNLGKFSKYLQNAQELAMILSPV